MVRMDVDLEGHIGTFCTRRWMRLQATYSGCAGMMHYCMGNDSALDRIDAIRGLVAYDLDRAEVLGGREMRRYSRTVSTLAPIALRGLVRSEQHRHPEHAVIAACVERDVSGKPGAVHSWRTFMNQFRIGLLLAVVVSAAGCGGGRTGSEPLPDADEIRRITGSQPPLETPGDQTARVAGLQSRTDSLIASTVVGETSSPQLPLIEVPFEARMQCAGTRCSWRVSVSGTGISGRIEYEDLSFTSGTATAVLSKHGITTVEKRGADMRPTVRG